jgi:uncharacterized protein (DUF433 family)
MSETVVMTLRLAPKVARSIERLAVRSGHKPAQLGARLLEEALRRREHPQVELRETAAGRVAYMAGTRLAVYWVKQRLDSGLTVEQFARTYELPAAAIQAALAYAQAFPDEIQADIEEAEANQGWIAQQDWASRPGPAGTRTPRKARR